MERTIVFLMCLLCAGCWRGDKPTPKFEPGQVWQYKTRPDEEASKLTVVKVDPDEKLGSIVHVQIKDLAIKNPKARGGYERELPLVHFSEKALGASVTTMDSTGPVPTGWDERYKHWKAAFEKGETGVWSAPVAEAIASLERVYGN